VSKLRIPGVSAVFVPSTARTAAAALAGFLEGGAHGTSVAADSGSARHSSSRRGRFARLDALEPRVSKLRIPGVSAVLVPSTARAAAAAFAGFLEAGAHETSVAADSGSARCRDGC